MKSTYGILWYFFIIYATSVVVNFSHYHKTFADDTNESVLLSATRCLMRGTGRTGTTATGDEDNSCKLSFQYKKETVLQFLKNLMSKKEFNKFYKLSLKNSSKKGTSDLINITLDLKPLFETKNSSSTNTDQLGYFYSFYIFISILLITFITPLFPLINYIYIITLISMILFSITVYLHILKLIMFIAVYLITLKKYKFWLLPNLNSDVGLLSTFWPLYELDSTEQCNAIDQVNKSEQATDQNTNRMFNNKPNKINLNSIENDSKTSLNKQTTDDRATVDKLLVNNEDHQSAVVDSSRISSDKNKQQLEKTITQFVGKHSVPTIITTPPPNSSKFAFENANIRPKLEIVDLNNEKQDVSDSEHKSEANRKINMVEGRQRLESIDTNCLIENCTASITPAVSYLNVNEIRRRQHSPARSRIASNRSDDGFEILNNDFLRNSQSSKEDDLFVCAKQDL